LTKLPAATRRILVIVALASAPAAPAALTAQSAAGAGPEADRLEWTVAPYLLVPTMSGDITVRNQTIGVDADPGDIFDKLQFGAMLYIQVRKGDWGGAVDGIYMNLEQHGAKTNATAGAKQGAVEVSVFRRLTPALDALVGARVNILESSLDLPTLGVSVSDTKTWVDPLIGVLLHLPTGQSRWMAAMRADIGGFGVGSTLAYQLYPTIGYQVSHLISLHAAYRYLNMDYETGSGSDHFHYDMSIFGPELGLAFHF
jgi:hypothetical protein